jgi:hypothetical protein
MLQKKVCRTDEQINGLIFINNDRERVNSTNNLRILSDQLGILFLFHALPNSFSSRYSPIFAFYYYQSLNCFKGPILRLNLSALLQRQRAVLVNYLIAIHCKYNFSDQTLWYTINYIDRYLDRRPTHDSRHYLILGVVAVLLSSKLHESKYLSVSRCVRLLDGVYDVNRKELLDSVVMLEQRIVTVLNADLYIPTAYHFIVHLIGALYGDAVPEGIEALALYSAESALIHYEFTSFSPRDIAAGAVYVSIMMQCAAVSHTQLDNNSLCDTYTEPRSVISDLRAASPLSLCSSEEKETPIGIPGQLLQPIISNRTTPTTIASTFLSPSPSPSLSPSLSPLSRLYLDQIIREGRVREEVVTDIACRLVCALYKPTQADVRHDDYCILWNQQSTPPPQPSLQSTKEEEARGREKEEVEEEVPLSAVYWKYIDTNRLSVSVIREAIGIQIIPKQN